MHIINMNLMDVYSKMINQKLEPTFPYDNEDLESNLENNNISSEKNIALNKIFKENDIYSPKILKEFDLINFDSLSGYNFDWYLIITNENNNSHFYKDLFPSFNREKSNTFRKDKKIFEIVKANNKVGRIKKNSFIKGMHTKLSEDNIIRKIKRRFQENIRLYINNEYKKYLLNKTFQKKKINNWLKKIDPKISRKIKKEENLKWFEMKILDIFSENVSSKYSIYSPYLNKNKIKRLISLNEAKNVIDILNTCIETLYNKYINDEKKEGFKTLKDDIKELKIHMEATNQTNIQDYLIKYEYIAQNLKSIFLNKVSRNKKRNHKNK